MMAALPYIGIAIFSAGIGFLICAVWLADRYWTLTGERDRLAVGLANASNLLRASGQREAANTAFEILDQNGGVE